MGDQDQPVGRFWASTSGNFTITWLHSLSMFSLSIRPKVQFLVMLYQCLYIPTLLSFWGYVMLYIHIFRNKCPFIWIRESVSVGSWEEGTQPPTERLRNPSCFACSNAKTAELQHHVSRVDEMINASKKKTPGSTGPWDRDRGNTKHSTGQSLGVTLELLTLGHRFVICQMIHLGLKGMILPSGCHPKVLWNQSDKPTSTFLV